MSEFHRPLKRSNVSMKRPSSPPLTSLSSNPSPPKSPRNSFTQLSDRQLLYRKDEEQEGKKLTKVQIRKSLHADQSHAKFYNKDKYK